MLQLNQSFMFIGLIFALNCKPNSSNQESESKIKGSTTSQKLETEEDINTCKILKVKPGKVVEVFRNKQLTRIKKDEKTQFYYWGNPKKGSNQANVVQAKDLDEGVGAARIVGESTIAGTGVVYFRLDQDKLECKKFSFEDAFDKNGPRFGDYNGFVFHCATEPSVYSNYKYVLVGESKKKHVLYEDPKPAVFIFGRDSNGDGKGEVLANEFLQNQGRERKSIVWHRVFKSKSVKDVYFSLVGAYVEEYHSLSGEKKPFTRVGKAKLTHIGNADRVVELICYGGPPSSELYNWP